MRSQVIHRYYGTCFAKLLEKLHAYITMKTRFFSTLQWQSELPAMLGLPMQLAPEMTNVPQHCAHLAHEVTELEPDIDGTESNFLSVSLSQMDLDKISRIAR